MAPSAAKVEQMARVMAAGRDDMAVLSQFYLKALERIKELEAQVAARPADWAERTHGLEGDL